MFADSRLKTGWLEVKVVHSHLVSVFQDRLMVSTTASAQGRTLSHQSQVHTLGNLETSHSDLILETQERNCSLYKKGLHIFQWPWKKGIKDRKKPVLHSEFICFKNKILLSLPEISHLCHFTPQLQKKRDHRDHLCKQLHFLKQHCFVAWGQA